MLDAAGRERFVDAGAPDISDLSPRLETLLNADGPHVLAHPAPTNSTTTDALGPIGRALGTTIPAAVP